MKHLKLAGKGSALLDDDDYAVLSGFSWFDDGKNGIPYPVRLVAAGDNKKVRLPLLRALYPDLRPKERVKFLNGNRLDFRRKNISVEKQVPLAANTLQRGAMAEVFICYDLIRQGYYAFIPFQGYAPCDIVAVDANDKAFRIQVKHARRSPNGSINASLRTVHTNSRGTVSKGIDPAKFDILAIFCPDTQKAYYIPSAEINGKSVAIYEGETPKISRLATDYHQMPTVPTTGIPPESRSKKRLDAELTYED